ncbi:hypothetical protein [Rickettsia asembonensis]|uniref:hypothetical protein n=1 Tax=Rickettsia asembonensis TaxID=1068590 RepID=UPI0018F1850F|nr:hypothetical protein [Rickettsia asembonensis]
MVCYLNCGSFLCHSRVALLRRPVKPTVSPRGLLTRSIKTTKNTNNFSIFNWIPWSNHGMTEVKLVHATTSFRGGGNPLLQGFLKSRFISLYAGFPLPRE